MVIIGSVVTLFMLWPKSDPLARKYHLGDSTPGRPIPPSKKMSRAEVKQSLNKIMNDIKEATPSSDGD